MSDPSPELFFFMDGDAAGRLIADCRGALILAPGCPIQRGYFVVTRCGFAGDEQICYDDPLTGWRTLMTGYGIIELCRNDRGIITIDGVTYRLGEVVIIDGRKYILHTIGSAYETADGARTAIDSLTPEQWLPLIQEICGGQCCVYTPSKARVRISVKWRLEGSSEIIWDMADSDLKEITAEYDEILDRNQVGDWIHRMTQPQQFTDGATADVSMTLSFPGNWKYTCLRINERFGIHESGSGTFYLADGDHEAAGNAPAIQFGIVDKCRRWRVSDGWFQGCQVNSDGSLILDGFEPIRTCLFPLYAASGHNNDLSASGSEREDQTGDSHIIRNWTQTLGASDKKSAFPELSLGANWSFESIYAEDYPDGWKTSRGKFTTFIQYSITRISDAVPAAYLAAYNELDERLK